VFERHNIVSAVISVTPRAGPLKLLPVRHRFV